MRTSSDEIPDTCSVFFMIQLANKRQPALWSMWSTAVVFTTYQSASQQAHRLATQMPWVTVRIIRCEEWDEDVGGDKMHEDAEDMRLEMARGREQE